jgi:23S rRNA maturation mini-RNase III
MTATKEKRFDCIKMKNTIQAQVYAETQNMSIRKLLDYFNQPEKSSYKTHGN